MLRILILCAVGLPSLAFLVPALTQQEGTESQSSHERKADDIEIEREAIRILDTAETLSRTYARPVPASQLVVAAVRNLYERAGKEPPESLNRVLDRFAHSRRWIEANARVDALFGPVKVHVFGSAIHQLVARVAEKVVMPEIYRRERLKLADDSALRGEPVYRASLQAMLESLDPYCTIVTGEPLQRVGINNGYQNTVGVYLEVTDGSGPFFVRTVALEGPAVAAGLLPGDEIVELNGRSTSSMRLNEAVQYFDGTLGSSLALTIRRAGEEAERTITVNHSYFEERFVLGHLQRAVGKWDHWIDARNRLALVRLIGISRDADSHLNEVLAELGDADLAGLILDLRDCPGGALHEATTIAGLFLKGQPVARSRYRDPEQGRAYAHPMQTTYTDFSMVVLVGPETSGGGELIAAALKDHDRAVICGQRSRGKASIQQTDSTMFRGYEVRLSTGVFMRPNGKNLHRFTDSKIIDDWGVRPDEELEIRMSPQLRRKLREWRLQHDLRPPNSRRALALDKPGADPVLETAVEYLRKKLHSEDSQTHARAFE